MSDTNLDLTSADIHRLFEECSNWGRWGEEDQRGALNYITEKQVQKAASLVTRGITVGCGLPLATKPSPENPRPVTHVMESAGDFDEDPYDYIGLSYHGFAHTHIDALCHVFYKDYIYNGFPKSSVTSHGATVAAIDVARHGVVGRGVLLDIPRSTGKDWLDPGTPILTEDLERAEKESGVQVGEGDILLVRNGRHTRAAAGEPVTGVVPVAGLHASTLPWLHDRKISVLGSDAVNDVLPSRVSDYRPPIHGIAIPAMGVHLLDNANFDNLAESCAQHGQWEFQFVISPWFLRGGTGSPVNPVAIF